MLAFLIVCGNYVCRFCNPINLLIMYLHTCIATYIHILLDHTYILHTYVRSCVCLHFSDDNEYCRIVHVSIIVLGIYTFGTSLLLWWLHKKLAGLLCENDSEGSTYVAIAKYAYLSSYM